MSPSRGIDATARSLSTRLERVDQGSSWKHRAPTLRILSWNVLADRYLDFESYVGLPDRLRRPTERWPAVAAVAADADRDVVALQEAEPALVDQLRNELGSDWDVRWCPKGQGRTDGCLTAVHRRWMVVDESRIQYPDGSPPSGHVAHLLTISRKDHRIVVANTHLRWAPPNLDPPKHQGLVQARALVKALDDGQPVVIVGDLNDEPDGPIRRHLADSGFREVQGRAPTALIRAECKALDVIAVRAATGHADEGPITVPSDGAEIPSTACPSDHVPVLATLQLATGALS